MSQVNMALLDRLTQHQQAVTAILDRSAPLLDGGGADAMELSRTRWEMMRVLTAYQRFKHREIFDPAIRAGTGPVRAMGEALKADCIALGDAFTSHVQHWSRYGTADDWAAYRTAASTMRDRIRRHLRQEERGVAALIKASAGAPGPSR